MFRNDNNTSKSHKVFKNVYFKQIHDEKEYRINIKNGKCIIPEGVKTIDDGQFEGMLTLTSISIPTTLMRIGEKTMYRTGINDVN